MHPRARRSIASLLAVGLGGLLVPLLASPAAAHEERAVGKYHLEVGFGDEPAYTGVKNSVIVLLKDAADKPMTNLGDTLKVEVSAGDQPPATLSLVPNFEVGGEGEQGDYRAWFFPTAPGKYTFHLTGSIKGQKVDERFTSSPTTFDEVQDPGEVQIPVKQPTSGQLTTRLDREIPRLSQALAASQAAQRQARDDATQARLLAIIGLVVGMAGLVLGGLALTRRSGKSRPVDAPASTERT